MSLMSDFQVSFFVFFGIISIASALFITRQKNVFYAAIGLIFLGISVAAMIALINFAYSFYSAFHILLYVGSTVVFLAISLVMFRGLNVKEVKISWAPIIALLVGVFVFIDIFATFSSITPVSTLEVFSLQTLANEILQNYWFPALILIIALLTTMIEAISLARRD
ncbi:NADH-quinone oxidoreductase subunit J family protein [Sulfurisphaera tokodaii]|nr:NADH-quinone oxidoreductase subunit J [Sulfurisphaera tokodaii]HII73044.1 NADH-quinone oxidoreductase subunit J [Sulfurisphaera tokodaii]